MLSVILIVGGVLELILNRTLIGLVLLLNLGVVLADADRLRQAGHKVPGLLAACGIILLPLHLWKRISLSKRNGMAIFWTWWGAVILSLLMSWPVYEREQIEETARVLVTEIIRDNGWGSVRCTRVEITSSSGDEYRAIATLDNGRFAPITIQKSRRGVVYVEMRRPW